MKRQKTQKRRLSPDEVRKMTQRCCGHFQQVKSWSQCAEWVDNAYRQLTGEKAPGMFSQMIVDRAKALKMKQDKRQINSYKKCII